jgi:hypothetical protein
VTDFKMHLSMLSPEEKLEVLKEMGFRENTPSEHAADCVSRQGSGFICTCEPPVTTWTAPAEVRQYMGEDNDSRRKFAEKRWEYMNNGIGESPGLWVFHLERTAPRHRS